MKPLPPEMGPASDDPADVTSKVKSILKVFSLENAAGTIVGDNLTRGCSGGEKKRVTLAEMLMGNQRVLLLDDISTGLDSATTKDIVAACKVACRDLGISCLLTLLQPPPEVFAMFDKVMLMREGSIVYHGTDARVWCGQSRRASVCPRPQGRTTRWSRTLTAWACPARATRTRRVRTRWLPLCVCGCHPSPPGVSAQTSTSITSATRS